MYTYSIDTAQAHLTLDVPTSLRLLAFGGLPTNNAQQILHDQTTASNYFSFDRDGTITTGHAQAQFCGQNTTTAAIFPPGHYHLTLELIQTPEGPYVKITY